MSLGALAMGMVVLRGAIQGEHAGSVAVEAMVALCVFMVVGAIAGWIADYLVRDALERMFRARIEWYRQGMKEAGYIEDDTPAS